jgi:hypothetical protein
VLGLSLYFIFKPAKEISKGSGLVMGTAVENINGINHNIETYYGSAELATSEEMLENLKLEVFPEDKTTFFPDPGLRLGSKIVIKRATPIIVADADNKTTYRTWAGNIKDFLQEKNIELGKDDKIEPALETSIKDNLNIKIIRVAITEIKEKENIAYKTITRDDPNMDKGTTRVEQNGQTGAREKTYQVTRENGKEISRQLLKNEVTKEPKDKIIIRGTKAVIYGQGKASYYPGVGALTAAHNSLPKGTRVLVTNLANGKSVEVTIMDKGIQGDFIIDLSKDAFTKIGSTSQGVVNVRLEKP